MVAITLLLLTWVVPWLEIPLLTGLWPSGVALILVFLFHRVLVGLLIGGFAGGLLICGGNPLAAVTTIFGDILVPAFQSSWKLSALLFTLLLGGFAALIERGGGLETLVHRFLRRGRGNTARRFQRVSMGLGLFCFFDGLANSILLGRVTRSLADRCGVSREKMAYLVDSTSSAVACIAFISTWIAFQLTLIEDGLTALGQPGNPYLLYFASIPRNFYALFTLAFLFIVISTDFNPGPMRRFEDEARKQSQGLGQIEEGVAPSGMHRALIPLLGLILSIMGYFLLFYAWEHPGADWGSWKTYGFAFSGSFGPEAMVAGTLTGLLLAFIFYPRRSERDPALPTFLSGVRALILPVFILVAAWILGGVIERLDTAIYLTGLLQGRFPLGLLAGTVFLTGAVISFSTGTSWGTMALVMPLAIPAVFSLGSVAELEPWAIQNQLSLVIAAVFSGAVFGDHCSPFSDTTIVSSIACGVEPEEHVRTQIPFALVAGGVALVLGFIPAGFGFPVLGSLLMGIVFLAILPFIWKGRRGFADLRKDEL